MNRFIPSGRVLVGFNVTNFIKLIMVLPETKSVLKNDTSPVDFHSINSGCYFKTVKIYYAFH